MLIDIQCYLIVSSILFSIGIYAVLTKPNVVMMLIGIEFMINPAIINFVAFSKYDSNNEGQIMAIFIIIMAAAGVAVALAIILNLYKHYKTIDPNQVHELGEK